MPFSPKSIEEKPYNMCVNCAHIGKNCDGPNFLAMEMPRLCEWCRLRKDYLHNLDSKWTNAYIAEQSGISKVSVDRFLSGNVDDLKISTISRILKVLVNGSWGQYPCAMAGEQEKEVVYKDNPELVATAENAIAQCKKLQATLDNINAEHKADLAAAHSDDRKKIDYLMERIEYLKEQIKFKESQMATKDNLVNEYNEHVKRKNRVITILSILVAICVLVIIAFLVADVLNPNKGFFWLSDFFGGATKGIFKNIL